MKNFVFPNNYKECLKKVKSRKAKSKFHIANHIPKSLLPDDFNHLKDSRLKITQSRVIKSRISVDIQLHHGARKAFGSRITKNNFLNSRFTENKIN